MITESNLFDKGWKFDGLKRIAIAPDGFVFNTDNTNWLDEAEKYLRMQETKVETLPSGVMKDRSRQSRYDLITPRFLERLAERLHLGAQKYSPENWKKGTSDSTAIDSLLSHLTQYRIGDRSEDHLAAVTFWVMVLMWNEEEKENG